MAREIEVKLLADGVTYAETVTFLRDLLNDKMSSFESGTSIDSYWNAPIHMEASSCRLRISDTAEFTVKVEDQGNNVDRKEHNVPVAFDKKDDMMEAMTALLGTPVPILWRYTDFHLGKIVAISVIQNIEAPHYTFVEVEGAQRSEVDYWVKKLQDSAEFTLKPVKNSFYSIFVQRRGVAL